MKPIEIAASLRAAADVVEKMPENSCGMYSTLCIYAREPEHFRALAKAMVPFEKGNSTSDYDITREFGNCVTLKASIDRGKICKKVKVLKEVEEFECSDSLLDPLTESEVPA